ncbi:hypothetical protein M432DRAFT_152777 [Thermoascus aurantiacus ATCC 26904]
MVFLRLTVKVLPREQLPSTSSTFLRSILGDRKDDADASAAKPATFLLVLRNPEEVTLGGLAGMIQEKWKKLRPDAEPLEIKKLLDDQHDDDLDADLTVADVFVDNGKALRDGLDQRATVRVVQKPAPYAPARFSSVVQDWDAAAQEYERRKQAEERAKPPVTKFPTIEEEPRLSFSNEPYDVKGGVGVFKGAPPHRDVPVRSVERDEDMLAPPNWGREITPVVVHDSQENEVAATPQPQTKRTASQELGGSPTPAPPPSKARRLSKESGIARAQSVSESRSRSRSTALPEEEQRTRLSDGKKQAESLSEGGRPVESLPKGEKQAVPRSEEENEPEILSKRQRPEPPSDADKQLKFPSKEEKQLETPSEEERPKSVAKSKKRRDSLSKAGKQSKGKKQPSATSEPPPEPNKSGQDVEMTDVEPEPPRPQSQKEPSLARDSPAIVVSDTAADRSWHDQFLTAATRKRKKSSEQLPPKKEPRLELSSSPSAGRSKSRDRAKAKDAERKDSTTEPETVTVEPETSTAEPLPSTEEPLPSTAETQVASPSPLRRRERAPSYSGPQRRLSFGEKSGDALKPGLGLGITKSPPRKQPVMLDSPQHSAKRSENDQNPVSTTPLFPSSARDQTSSNENDATPTAQTQGLEQLKRLPPAIRNRDSPFDRHQERRSVSFAEEATVATPTVLPAQSTPRNGSKASKSTPSSISTSTPDSARPMGTMVFPTNVPKERLEQYMNEAAQKVQEKERKIEEEKREFNEKIEKAKKENADPEYLRLLTDAYFTWEEIMELERTGKKDDVRRANRLRPKLASKRKLIAEMEDKIKAASVSAPQEEAAEKKAAEVEEQTSQNKSSKKSAQKKPEEQQGSEKKASEKKAPEKMTSEKASEKAPSSNGKDSKKASSAATETEQTTATPEAAKSNQASPEVNGVPQPSLASDDGLLPSTEKVRSSEETKRKSDSPNEPATTVENTTENKSSEPGRKSPSPKQAATDVQDTIMIDDSSDQEPKRNSTSSKSATATRTTRSQESSEPKRKTTTAVRNITRIEESSDGESTEPMTESDQASQDKTSEGTPSEDATDKASSSEEDAPEITKAKMLERVRSPSVARTASSPGRPSPQKQEAKPASDSESSSSESESEDDSDDGMDELLRKKPNNIPASSQPKKDNGPASRTGTPLSQITGNSLTKPSSFAFSSFQPQPGFKSSSQNGLNGISGINKLSRADRATLKSMLEEQRTELAERVQRKAAAAKANPQPVKPPRKEVYDPPSSDSESSSEDSDSESESESGETGPSDAERGDILPTGTEKKISRPRPRVLSRVGR